MILVQIQKQNLVDFVLDVQLLNTKILILEHVWIHVLLLDIQMMQIEFATYVLLHVQLAMVLPNHNVCLVKQINTFSQEDVLLILHNVQMEVMQMVPHGHVNLVMQLVFHVLMVLTPIVHQYFFIYIIYINNKNLK